MALDRTADFRNAVDEKRKEIPESKRRRISRPKAGAQSDEHASQGKEYVAEAYTILNHITTLTRMLSNIRKPYLNVDSRSPLGTRHNARNNIDLATGTDQAWAGVRHLTNEERDQIDLQARVILSRCADRVKEMEALEKRRAELVARKTNPFTRLLPSRLTQDDSSSASSDFTAAHHASITWYLSRRLTEASQAQKEMQEERVKRQLERSRTLGSGAARDALHIGSPQLVDSESGGGGSSSSWLQGASSSFASGFAATLGAPSPNASRTTLPSPPPPDDLDSSNEDDELELSQSQILQFESENATILRSVQDTLSSVQAAEAHLLDISALQLELVSHLSRQTALTDQLYEDAVATTGTVEKGNAQLREARRRARDGRKWVLVFLVGASLSLLFLHYY
ncbi:hypothetical protein PLICRDRAFT_98625 [Plicaturopsis crispa FD-325 SS-3]|nr:hypothetical protein PLICRDRAFT_98625 [Plicaturopsis crispa FD-325 SS-3]